VCSQLFDHTSLLRFIETRFGVEVPNLSPGGAA
jgi:phospholipase C